MAEVGCLRDAAFQNVEVNGVHYPGRVPIVNLGAARTILPEESGTTFTVESAGGAYDITLPTVALGRGCRFRFIAVVNRTNVLFDTTCLHGDWIEIIGNGTNYFVSGQGSIQGAFTAT